MTYNTWPMMIHSLWAYLDPGSGSYLIQILLAGVLGAMFTATMWWRKLRDYVTRRASNKGTDERSS